MDEKQIISQREWFLFRGLLKGSDIAKGNLHLIFVEKKKIPLVPISFETHTLSKNSDVLILQSVLEDKFLGLGAHS